MITTNRKRDILTKLASKSEAAKQTAGGVWQAITGAVKGVGDAAGRAGKNYMDVVKGGGTGRAKTLIDASKKMKKVDPKQLAQAQAFRRKEILKRTAAIGVPAAGVAGGVYALGRGKGKKKARKKLGLTKSEYKSLTKSMTA